MNQNYNQEENVKAAAYVALVDAATNFNNYRRSSKVTELDALADILGGFNSPELEEVDRLSCELQEKADVLARTIPRQNLDQLCENFTSDAVSKLIVPTNRGMFAALKYVFAQQKNDKKIEFPRDEMVQNLMQKSLELARNKIYHIYGPEESMMATLAYGSFFSAAKELRDKFDAPSPNQFDALDQATLGATIIERAKVFAAYLPRERLDALCENFDQKNLTAICEPQQAEIPGVNVLIPEDERIKFLMQRSLIEARADIDSK